MQFLFLLAYKGAFFEQRYLVFSYPFSVFGGIHRAMLSALGTFKKNLNTRKKTTTRRILRGASYFCPILLHHNNSTATWKTSKTRAARDIACFIFSWRCSSSRRCCCCCISATAFLIFRNNSQPIGLHFLDRLSASHPRAAGFFIQMRGHLPFVFLHANFNFSAHLALSAVFLPKIQT